MSDDKDDKTEEPTAKRLSEAADKGNVPKSQEVMHFFALFGIGIVILGISGIIARHVSNVTAPIIANAWQIEMTGGALQAMIINLMIEVFSVLLIPAGLMLALGLLATRIQHGFPFSAENMKPKLSKISPISGLKKKFSMQTLVEFGKSMLKLVIFVPLVMFALQDQMSTIGDLIDSPVLQGLVFVQDSSVIILSTIVPIMLVIAAADFAYQKHTHIEKLKMTRQEVKDEHKQSEGNPEIKNRIRQIRIQRFRQRIAESVPGSDVVITNPTHYAVALKYDPEKGAAPVLVAKGADFLALKIRELASDYEVPIMENPPLARAIYANVEVDQEIRPEHYEAVAKIISYVMGIKNGTKNASDKPKIDGEFAN